MSWNASGGYFRAPYQKFFGLLIVAGVITFAIASKNLPSRSLILAYSLSWLVDFLTMLTIGGLIEQARIGFCLMGSMMLWAAISTWRRVNHEPLCE
jgi:hypothetical protein